MTVILTLLALLLPQAERPVILAVGDSMTAGYGVAAEQSYPAQLEKELLRRGFNYRVVNQGVTGSTTAQARSNFTRGLALSPAIVIIQLGGNDVSAGISPAVSRENIRLMISRLKPGRARVFLAGGRFPLLDELARAEGVTLIPFFEGVQGNPDLLISDGRHPNGEGYAVIVRNILKVLEPSLERVH
jgi:acyl-CoA thioesterase-1